MCLTEMSGVWKDLKYLFTNLLFEDLSEEINKTMTVWQNPTCMLFYLWVFAL